MIFLPTTAGWMELEATPAPLLKTGRR